MPVKKSRRYGLVRLILVLLVALSIGPLAGGLGAIESARAAPPITEFPVTTPASGAVDIAFASDGTFWFTEQNANKIGRITTGGAVTEYTIPTGNSAPTGIASGSDTSLWFTEQRAGKIGRITLGGAITEFAVPSGGNPTYITAGPDRALWFGVNGTNTIGRITTAGAVTEFTIPTASATPLYITTGRDGALWFTEYGASKIGRITTAGAITEFPIPTANSIPQGIASGPDGALWFTENSNVANKIGRITTAGVITEFPIPTPTSFPARIVRGQDGNLWFTEYGAHQIATVTTAGAITEYPVPTGNSQPQGITQGPEGTLWFTENSGNQIGRLSLNLPPATLTVKPATGGTTSLLIPGPFVTGQQTSLLATPDPGQLLAFWAGNSLISDNGLGIISDNGAGAVPQAQAATGAILPLGPWNLQLNATITGDNASVRPVFVARPSFSDVPADHPAYDQITRLAARGIIHGYQPEICADLGLGAPCFGPDDHTQRAQMAALIARSMGWDAEDWPDSTFPDQGTVDDDLWRNVRTLAHYGVARGYADGTYNPNGDVLQVQVILFISRAMVQRGFWEWQPDDPSLYPNLPATNDREVADRRDVATFVHYAGAVPGAPADPGQNFVSYADPSTRAWFTLALWQALDSYFGR